MDNNNKLSTPEKALNAGKYTVVFRISGQILSLAVTLLIVHALSEYEYGVYNILYSIVGLITIVASFGLANTLQRYIPEYYKRQEYSIANNIFKTASILRLVSNVMILGILLYCWEGFASWLNILPYKKYFMIFSVIIILYMQRELLEICLNSFFLQKYTYGFSLIFTSIKALGYIYVILLAGDLWVVLLVDLMAYLTIFVILQFVYRNKISSNIGTVQKLNYKEKKKIQKYALFYNFNDTGVGLLNANFDNFILVMFLNPVAVGGYAFCQRLTKQINQIIPINYFQDVLRPLLFSYNEEKDKREILVFFQIITKINLILMLPILSFWAIYGNLTIDIFFGGKFSGYGNVLSLVYAFSIPQLLPIGLIAQLRERADIILYSKIFAAYNLIGDLILIKYFGILGAVFATGTAMLGKNLFIWHFVKEDANFKGMKNFFIKIILFWGAMSLFLICFNRLVSVQNVVCFLLGCILVGSGILIQLRCGLFNEAELSVFNFIGTNEKRIEILLSKVGIFKKLSS